MKFLQQRSTNEQFKTYVVHIHGPLRFIWSGVLGPGHWCKSRRAGGKWSSQFDNSQSLYSSPTCQLIPSCLMLDFQMGSKKQWLLPFSWTKWDLIQMQTITILGYVKINLQFPSSIRIPVFSLIQVSVSPIIHVFGAHFEALGEPFHLLSFRSPNREMKEKYWVCPKCQSSNSFWVLQFK